MRSGLQASIRPPGRGRRASAGLRPGPTAGSAVCDPNSLNRRCYSDRRGWRHASNGHSDRLEGRALDNPDSERGARATLAMMTTVATDRSRLQVNNDPAASVGRRAARRRPGVLGAVQLSTTSEGHSSSRAGWSPEQPECRVGEHAHGLLGSTWRCSRASIAFEEPAGSAWIGLRSCRGGLAAAGSSSQPCRCGFARRVGFGVCRRQLGRCSARVASCVAGEDVRSRMARRCDHHR